MTYLEEFKTRITNREFPKFFQLWEEYSANDIVDAEEYATLLRMIKGSEMAKPFGQVAETAIPLWNYITDPKSRYEVLKLIIDLQNTNSPLLGDLALQAVTENYGSHPKFAEALRLTGLRNKDNFSGSISNFDLLMHMIPGKFVYHTGGWGTGEIMEISDLREQVSVEFENVSGRKHLTFPNAFKTLIPLEDSSFLARRFSDADTLEQEARNNPIAIIKLLLQDLGPRNAGEIKDDLCELVIPEKDWTKWWQGARAKLKKDPLIETPENLRDPFRLRKEEISQEERLNKAIRNKTGPEEIILSAYNFIRDLPDARKHQEVKKNLQDRTVELLTHPELTKSQELQILILLENFFGHQVNGKSSEELIKKIENIEPVINAIEIQALKKKTLALVREYRKDWAALFLSLLLGAQQGPLRDYILKELNKGDTQKLLIEKLKHVAVHPGAYPEFCVWFFQKITSDEDKDVPFSDKEGQCLFFESFLILYSILENKPEYRDLLKKMYVILSGKRFATVRQVIENTSVDFIKEFLLLTSKCQSLSDHDIKILRSLAEVAHPSLVKKDGDKKKIHFDSHTIWTTEAGFMKTQERVKHIGTKEMIENAREVEAARALGDLRENSEYKFACERRSRLQGEMKTLSELLNRARIITKDDISLDEVGVGNIVEVKDNKGVATIYTILGPWDADAEENILSFQSKFALAMIGYKEGETFQFKDEDYTITGIKSFLDK